MAAKLNHLIVPSKDKWASARFLANVLGIAAGPEWGRFVSVKVDNDVIVDFANSARIEPMHLAFLVSDETFDTGLATVRAAGVQISGGPGGGQPGEINHLYGGRGFYFHDLDGHLFELITAPYGDEAATIGSWDRVSVSPTQSMGL